MKATQKVIEQRVEEILQLRLLGALPTDICRHAREQGWNVSQRQIERYMQRADALLMAGVERNRDRLLAYHFAARRALYARCMAVSDHATAARVLRDEAELLALYPPKQVGLVGSDGGPIVLNVVEEIIDRPRPLFPFVEVSTNGHAIDAIPAITDASDRTAQNRPA